MAPTMPPTGNPDDTLHPELAHPERRLDRTASPESCPSLRLPADPVAPSVARHQLRRWLSTLSWPSGQLEDIVLAVSEAVSNAAEHAYLDQAPGVIEIDAWAEVTAGGQRQVTVVVGDHGRWRTAPMDDENRRRGIPLMRACMDTVTIEQPDDRSGTRVVLRSRAVPPHAS